MQRTITLAVVLAMTNSYLLLADSTSLDELRGLAGPPPTFNPAKCKNCTEPEFVFSECGHIVDTKTSKVGRCESDWCIKNLLYYAKCQRTGISEIANCNQKEEDDITSTQAYFKPKNNLTCKQGAMIKLSTHFKTKLPGVELCQSPDFGKIEGKCFIDNDACKGEEISYIRGKKLKKILEGKRFVCTKTK